MKYKTGIFILLWILIITYLWLHFFYKKEENKVNVTEVNSMANWENVKWTPIYQDRISIWVESVKVSEESVKSIDLDKE